MNILVTGGTGFIGSHLVEQLSAKGYHVRCLVRKNSNISHIQNVCSEFVYGDLLDVRSLESAVRNAKYIFHLAAASGRSRPKEDYYSVNVLGTRNLLKACFRFNVNLDNFIYVSSVSAVGPSMNEFPLTEESPCLPVDFYGESKLAGEKVVSEYGNKLPATIIRPSLVYGPREKGRYKVLWHMKMTEKGFRIGVGSKKGMFSIIYVKDLVEGFLAAAESNKSEGQKYILCNQNPTSFDEICKLSATALQKKTIPIRVPYFVRESAALLLEFYARMTNTRPLIRRKRSPHRSQHWVYDSSKAKRELSFQPRTSLQEGIENTAAWYVREGWK